MMEFDRVVKQVAVYLLKVGLWGVFSAMLVSLIMLASLSWANARRQVTIDNLAAQAVDYQSRLDEAEAALREQKAKHQDELNERFYYSYTLFCSAHHPFLDCVELSRGGYAHDVHKLEMPEWTDRTWEYIKGAGAGMYD